ncbi:Uncharacterised protein [Mycobacteroides abscessus subsp. abscessus]|nr:Uncharacterised protein [Mycobacteroides abscessus subsp. abscessus]SHT06003.1 Uncharacterised protein [Mycobacteroides abscessus subsp. abscessus]
MLTESQFREIADTLKAIANELRDMNDRTTLKACVSMINEGLQSGFVTVPEGGIYSGPSIA